MSFPRTTQLSTDAQAVAELLSSVCAQTIGDLAADAFGSNCMTERHRVRTALCEIDAKLGRVGKRHALSYRVDSSAPWGERDTVALYQGDRIRLAALFSRAVRPARHG